MHFPCCVTENQYMDGNKSLEVAVIDTEHHSGTVCQRVELLNTPNKSLILKESADDPRLYNMP